MKNITYKTLMKKIDDGMAEVWAWSRDGQYAEVIFYKMSGRSTRSRVRVTNQPKNNY